MLNIAAGRTDVRWFDRQAGSLCKHIGDQWIGGIGLSHGCQGASYATVRSVGHSLGFAEVTRLQHAKLSMEVLHLSPQFQLAKFNV